MIDFAPLNRPLRLKHCCHCGGAGAEYRRQHTAYQNEKSNWAWYCDPCQQMSDEHWDEMWAEYYRSVLY